MGGAWSKLDTFLFYCIFLLFFSTLQSIPQQRVQLWVKLRFLLQHVKEQLVLCGAGNLSLLQSALHHLHLRLPLSCLQALKRSDHSVRPFHLHFIFWLELEVSELMHGTDATT